MNEALTLIRATWRRAILRLLSSTIILVIASQAAAYFFSNKGICIYSGLDVVSQGQISGAGALPNIFNDRYFSALNIFGTKIGDYANADATDYLTMMLCILLLFLNLVWIKTADLHTSLFSTVVLVSALSTSYLERALNCELEFQHEIGQNLFVDFIKGGNEARKDDVSIAPVARASGSYLVSGFRGEPTCLFYIMAGANIEKHNVKWFTWVRAREVSPTYGSDFEAKIKSLPELERRFDDFYISIDRFEGSSELKIYSIIACIPVSYL